MLCQFSVKNFKSIKERATLDLQAANISEHIDRIIISDTGEKFLPITAIYGPNCGGKSNVIEALNSLINKVRLPFLLTGDNADKLILEKKQIPPFAFDEESRNAPTEFELFFKTDTAEYRYILHVRKDTVVYESLDRIKVSTRRSSALFERNGEIKLKGEFAKLKVSDGLSETLPLLSYLGLTYSNNEIINDICNWINKRLFIIDVENQHDNLDLIAASHLKDIKQLALEIFKEFDLGIDDFRIEQKEGRPTEIFTKHKLKDAEYELNLQDESNGTKKIFNLLPFIISALGTGATLVVDELDAKLHPLLLRHIIMLFCDMSINKHQAQLIFTSHNLSSMTSEIFRRDEIWFVAKGNEQKSILYSLVEFKTNKGSIRKDATFDKQYLEGKYGADPYLQRIVNWSEINE